MALKIKCALAYVYPGSSLLTGSDSLQLWSNVAGEDVEAEEEKQTKKIRGDSGCAWSCVWQSK